MSINDNRKTFEELECGDSVYVVNGNTQNGSKKCIIEYCVSRITKNSNEIIHLSLEGFHNKNLQHHISVLNSGQDIQLVDEFKVCSNFAALSNYIEKINNDYSKLANELILDRADYLEYLRLKNEQRS
jgi:hypothetical protein